MIYKWKSWINREKSSKQLRIENEYEKDFIYEKNL